MEAGNTLVFIVLSLPFSSLLILLRGQTEGKMGGGGETGIEKDLRKKNNPC